MKYWVVGQPDDDVFDLGSRGDHSWKWMARLAASDFWNNHDGHKLQWPLVLALYEKGKHVGNFQVDFIPKFVASEELDR